MSKSILMSIQPYWVFLIIAKEMGWNIDKEKTVEVRKTFPKDENWNKVAKIYCSKDKKSFDKIPKEYQPFMKQLLGKVIGEFVCDGYDEFIPTEKGIIFKRFLALPQTCLTVTDIRAYLRDKVGYGWHISNLKIYDKPKELSEFYRKCDEGCEACAFWKKMRVNKDEYDMDCSSPIYGHIPITRPPQSWCYVEDMEVVKYVCSRN